MNGIAAERLINQRIAGSTLRDPAAVVSWLGAVQAQDYAGAKWALALRTKSEVTDAQIERACDEGRILRTHVMRPTWHFVHPSDIRWLLDLTAPRVHRALAWGQRQFGLDAALLARATTAIERAVAAGVPLTRTELAARLARSGIRLKGTPLALAVMHAELEGLVCSGPRRGNQATYAPLATRAPHAVRRSRDEALGELATRYFRSHGPATARDFAWWSGLTIGDAKRAIEIARARHVAIDGRSYFTLARPRTAPPSPSVYLLPVFDEYLVAYRDLDAVPRANGRWGVLPRAMVLDGHVAGTWKVVRGRDRAAVQLTTAGALGRREKQALVAAAARLGRFLETPISL